MKSYDRKNKICIVHIQPIISAKAKKAKKTNLF